MSDQDFHQVIELRRDSGSSNNIPVMQLANFALFRDVQNGLRVKEC